MMHVGAAELPSKQQSYFSAEAQSSQSSKDFFRIILCVLRAFATEIAPAVGNSGEEQKLELCWDQ
jgi:hypothetical protein